MTVHVRESFNSICDPRVLKINRLTTNLLNLCDELKQIEPRLAAKAQTTYVEAEIWAVAAATRAARVERAVKERVEAEWRQ